MAAQCLRVWRQRACSVRMPCISPVRPALRPPRPVAVPQRQHVVTTARGKMEESLDREIEATAAAIDAMVREVTKELFVDTAAAYVTGEAASKEGLDASIRAAVTPRLDDLNATFLPILNSYIEAAQEQVTSGGDAAAMAQQRDLVGVLLAIKAEVLSELGKRLPPEMRAIQKALEAPSPETRMALLRSATGPDASPRCDAGALALTVGNMIGDFEAAEREAEAEAAEGGTGAPPTPVDRGFLARLCLMREELRMLADEAGMERGSNNSSSGDDELPSPPEQQIEVEVQPGVFETAEGSERSTSSSSSAPSASASPYTALRGVPAREASFIKELVGVGSSERRRALLEAAFRGDLAAVGPAGAGVRPGSFMDCLRAVQAEMTGPAYEGAEGTAADPAMLARLEEVWREAVLVLEDLAGQATYSP